MGFEAYESFFDQHAFPPVDNTDELLDSEFAAAFTAFGKDAVGDYKYVESGTASALKELLKLRGRNYFERSWVEDCWSVLSGSWKSQRARVTRTCHPTNDVPNQDVCLGASGCEPAGTGSLA